MDVKMKTEIKDYYSYKVLAVDAGKSYFEVQVDNDDTVVVTVEGDDIVVRKSESEGVCEDEKLEFRVEGEIYSDRVSIRLIDKDGNVMKNVSYGGEIAKLVKGMAYLSSLAI
jgi:hypothetical protein